jgi:hypothetical protein
VARYQRALPHERAAVRAVSMAHNNRIAKDERVRSAG